MASGINTTFRQIGTATGVAALGAVFASHVRSTAESHLAGTALGAHATGIAHAISLGGINGVLPSVPAKLQPAVIEAGHAGFVSGLNLILLVGAITAFAGAAATAVLVRERDFVESTEREPAEALPEPSQAVA
jgi:hypothetical protein